MFWKLKQAFRRSVLFFPYKKISSVSEYLMWRLRGSPSAGRPKVPHLIKQRLIAEFARNYNLHILVETGTNLGQMIDVNQGRFREIYSIELDEWKAAVARRKFADRPHIHTFLGDSGAVLPTIISAIKEPCLFWLDAHVGDSSAAIKQELDCIYKHPVQGHVLLIDDARWFDGRTDYPTMEELRAKAGREYPGRVVEVKDDVIRIYKPRS
jgi:hypothetical protein